MPSCKGIPSDTGFSAKNAEDPNDNRDLSLPADARRYHLDYVLVRCAELKAMDTASSTGMR